MDGNLRVDRDILIAGITSAISVIGICLVLFLGLRPKPGAVAAPERTATPFKYRLLATETYTAEPELMAETPLVVLDGQRTIPTSDPSGSPDASETGTPLETLASTVVVGDTPTVDEGQMLAVGKYDDTDMRITYYGDWTTEFFVDGAFEESLYVSTLVGNTVTFSFMGRQLVLGYLGSSDFDLGMVTVAIDGSPHQMDQSTGGNWTSPQLIFDGHFVVLTHQTGDVIYLDYIEIR